MKRRTKSLLEKYTDAKLEMRRLEALIEEIGGSLMDAMVKEGKEQLKDDNVTVSIGTRVTTVYPEEVKKKIKGIREAAESRGIVEYKSKPYLVLRLNEGD